MHASLPPDLPRTVPGESWAGTLQMGSKAQVSDWLKKKLGHSSVGGILRTVKVASVSSADMHVHPILSPDQT